MMDLTAAAKLDDRDALLCPVCNGTYLHHREIKMLNRFEENQEGIEISVLPPHFIGTRLFSSKQFPGSKDVLEISFRCRFCHEDEAKQPFVLRVLAYRGRTVFRWADLPKEETLSSSKTEEQSSP